MLINLRKKAQSTAEYVMLFAIVLGAVAMARSYLSKAIAGGIQYQANQLLTSTGGDLYDSTLDKKNTSKSARQSNEKQHQEANLDEKHAYNETISANVEHASIGGDLQEAEDAADAFKIAGETWDARGSKVANP
ncbi:MAG: hypothetical protein PHT31_05465 [Candidatus Omnitrophica bacterium]|nr:hypothetical protein [Candidatus Omnitrophota bacterium]MDD5653588.1 hypothetical protein [Candidatus Omnitrophota bacterium]